MLLQILHINLEGTYKFMKSKRMNSLKVVKFPYKCWELMYMRNIRMIQFEMF